MDFGMRPDVFLWAIAALVLVALEMLAPGAFMLWLGFAAGALALVVWLVPGLPFLVQAILFVVFAAISVQISRKWFRGRESSAERSTLNRRAEQLVGRIVPLESAIAQGAGRVQIADAFWQVSGPDLPAGANVRIVDVHGMILKVEAAD
jgi:inner membrane protein